jgi:hypothetical protein
MAVKCIYDIEAKYSHRYADVMHKSEKILESIQAYENIALVSLEEAVEPLISLVPKIKRMVWTVKQRCEKPADNLSPDESASIMLFSMELEPIENSFYRIFNKTLRKEDQRELEPWLLYRRLFASSLSKLPLLQDQTIYTAATTCMSSQYPLGATFMWQGFLSCTKSVEVLERFLGKSRIKTLFKIECHSGKEIRKHSCFHTEDEVLLPTASKFQVISNYQESQDLCIIQLKEVVYDAPIQSYISHNTFVLQNELPTATAMATLSTSQNLNLQQRIAQAQPRAWIDLSHQQLVDQNMEIVAAQAIIDKQCTELDLGSNNITLQGVIIIGDALCNSSIMRRLYLSDNQLADDGVHHLMLSVENSSLFVLGLSKNGITDVGAQYLTKMLKKNQRLTVLGLEDNEISDQGVELLADALKYNRNLQRLLLTGNKKISDLSVNTIIDMLQHNKSLRKLDLRACNLSSSAKTRLREVVKTKKNFELLY